MGNLVKALLMYFRTERTESEGIVRCPGTGNSGELSLPGLMGWGRGGVSKGCMGGTVPPVPVRAAVTSGWILSYVPCLPHLPALPTL